MKSKNKPIFQIVGGQINGPDVVAIAHSVEAEKGVLGSMLISPQETIADCVEKISEAHFYVAAHRTIYAVLLELWRAGDAIDLVTFTQVLRDRNLLDSVGGAAFVTSLFTFVPTAANAAYYIEIVRNKYNLRHFIAACTESARQALAQPDDIPNLAHCLIEQAEQIQNFARGIGRLPALADASLMVAKKAGCAT